jgi:hypothetical protein
MERCKCNGEERLPTVTTVRQSFKSSRKETDLGDEFEAVRSQIDRVNHQKQMQSNTMYFTADSIKLEDELHNFDFNRFPKEEPEQDH